MSAASVTVSTAPVQGAGAGSTPSAALQQLHLTPLPFTVARAMVIRHHYLHSLAGGTRLAFGVFLGSRLLGVATLGVGPTNAHRLVESATPDDSFTLTRLWLSDELPPNSESRVLGMVLKALRRHSRVKFLVTYADPAHGHLGAIYQATNWLYTGLSEAMPLYDIGDGEVRHFAAHGVAVKLVPQVAKHRYLYFLDLAWRPRLRVPPLPYPKKESSDGGH